MKKAAYCFITVLFVVAAVALPGRNPRNQLSNEVVDAFRRPDAAWAYKLDPTPDEEDTEHPFHFHRDNFHGYKVLASAVLDSNQEAVEFDDISTSALKWASDPRKLEAACFNPRHGIVVIKNERQFELLICFECSQAVIFAQDGGRRQIFFEPSPVGPSSQILDDALTRSGGLNWNEFK